MAWMRAAGRGALLLVGFLMWTSCIVVLVLTFRDSPVFSSIAMSLGLLSLVLGARCTKAAWSAFLLAGVLSWFALVLMSVAVTAPI